MKKNPISRPTLHKQTLQNCTVPPSNRVKEPAFLKNYPSMTKGKFRGVWRMKILYSSQAAGIAGEGFVAPPGL